jgi:hypothetical protein
VAASYLLEASLSPGGPVIAAFSVAQPTLTVNGVADGVYYARVRAVNADGTGPVSNEVVVVVPGGGPCTAPPNAPTNFSATVFGTFVTLNWRAPASGCAPTAYLVQAGSSPGLTDITQINVGGMTTLSVQAPPGTYYVRVVALNNAGGSPASNEIVVTVTTAPPNIAGRWHGESNYFNAPFTFNLTQSGSQISGSYRDQYDTGSVFGVVNIGSVILDVRFADTGTRFEGSIESATRIRGIIRGGPIGGPYWFVMTRQP